MDIARPLEFGDVIFALSVELDYDLIIYERYYYTILDLLSDVGGI